MKKHLLLLFGIIAGICATAQDFNRDEIINEIRKELKDTSDNAIHVQEELQAMIDTLEKSKTDTFALFPFCRFDSVVYTSYKRHYSNRQPETTIKNRKISPLAIQQLLLLVNNPLNFRWGECGTPIPEKKIVFMHNGNEVAKITVGCNSGQLLIWPHSNLSRWGHLNDKGDEILAGIKF